jgi:hypothetical protein
MTDVAVLDSNPMNQDSKLKSLLRDVDSVETVDDFNAWRKSFLEIYTKYLDTKGSKKAAATYTKFSKSSIGLRMVVKQLQDLIDKGDLSTDRISVRAKMTISELKAKTSQLVQEIEKLLPSTEQEIQAFGFSKWHMGAVLVRDGFKEYAVMMHSRAQLKQLRVYVLDDVADRQILDEIDYFGKKFDIFCGVMADLGLMNACEKATEVLHAEMLQEARQAEESAKTLQREKLSASQHSTVIHKNKPLDTNRVAAFNNSPKKVDAKKVDANSPSEAMGYDGVEDEESDSSYETIEEIVTVISYETVENPDDSSYETVEEIEALSEYETDEEEIEWSEYETDSDSDKKGTWPWSFSRKKKPKDKDKKVPKEAPKPLKKKKPSTVPSSSSDKVKGSSPSKRKGGGRTKDRATSVNEQDEDDEESNSDSSGSADDESDSDKSSDSSVFVPAPIKMGKTKPWEVPDPKNDPYAPTERMKWKRTDYYHGAVERPKNLNKKKDPEPKSNRKPKEKKVRRVVHTKTIKTRRKLEKPPPKKIRVKKDKPPIKVRVRNEKQIVKKTRIKKDKAKPIPKQILVKVEKPNPSLSSIAVA